jgi:hypothetical protein
VVFMVEAFSQQCIKPRQSRPCLLYKLLAHT